MHYSAINQLTTILRSGKPFHRNESDLRIMSQGVNVNPEEIEKFEKVASQWWDTEGDFKPLHQINPLRLSFVQSHCGSLFDLNAIDVGCGGGILAESMARIGAKVTGIDLGEEPLNVAKLHALEAGVEISYEKIPVEDKATDMPEQFDLVTCMEMLEHVPDPGSVIKACAAMVKPGGKAFFSTLNKTTKSYLLAIVAAEKLLKLVPNGTHDWNKFIRPSQLIGWAESAGLRCIDATGIHYNPINENHKLAADLDVNYLLAFEKPMK